MKRDKKHDINGRLFQAAMWRQYAQRGGYAIGLINLAVIYTREECIRRARVNLYLARRLNRS